MSRTFGLIAPIAVMLSVSTGTALCETITYHYTGTVVNTNSIGPGPSLGTVQPVIGDEFSGTITYDLDAPGTPNGPYMGYGSQIPPAKMTFTIRGETFEGSEAVGITVFNDAASQIEEMTADGVTLSMGTTTPLELNFLLRVEDTSRAVLNDVDLPAWIPLERFDLRQFDVFVIEGGFAQQVVWGTVRTLKPVAITATIDIRPRRFPAQIERAGDDTVAVAILTRSGNEQSRFDALRVDPNTVRFGETGSEAAPVRHAQRDVDGDGDTDLLLFFEIEETGIGCGSISGMLTGLTFRGRLVRGVDSIIVAPCAVH